MDTIPYLLLCLCLVLTIQADPQLKTYAEKLGFPPEKKVIIFHVDDAGMSHDSNLGIIKSMEEGLASSTSVMMPCSWAPAYFNYLKKHPNTDAGVHLVLTSEWNDYRWHPLVGRDKAPGLYDEQGAFWHSVEQVATHASADEVEVEIRAQIARFRGFGFQPTHIDTHMGTLFLPKFVERYVKVGIEEQIPVAFPGGHATLLCQEKKIQDEIRPHMIRIGELLWNAGLPVIDDLDEKSYDWCPPATLQTDENLQKYKTAKYIELLESCKPGITYIIMHCTNPTPMFDNISSSGPTRKGDMLAMLDLNLKAFIDQEGIIVTNWRELIERRAKVNLT